MERNAHYALVGLISVLLFVGVAAFIIWLAGAQFAKRYEVYDIAFKGPVRGLSTGGEVFFNGIRVGEVTRLSLDSSDPDKVKARIRITSETPVRADSRAGLEPQGVTGVNYIQISAGTVKAPLLLAVTPAGRIPVILAKPSALESLLQGGGDVLTRTVEALDSINRLLSEDNIAQLSGTVRDLHALTTGLAEHRDVAERMSMAMDGVRTASEQISVLTRSSTALVNGDGRRALANAADAAAELKEAAKDARAIISDFKGPASDLAVNGVPQLNRTLISLQAAADGVTTVTNAITLDPSGLISKPASQTLKVKP